MSPVKPEFEHSDYRPNVGIVLINGEGKVWLGKRINPKGAWQMPQGGIDPGEDILSAARRELLEETGIPKEDIQLMAIHHEWLYYTFPNNKKIFKDGTEFKGQKQKWFLFKYLADDTKIDITHTEEKEFSNWKWVTPEEAIKATVDFRKPVYENVFEVFNKRIAFAIAE